MRVLALFLFAFLLSGPAAAEIVSPQPDAIELTVYRARTTETSQLNLEQDSGGIAMVTERRTIDLPSGTSVIRFRGVAAGIVPQTAKLLGVPAQIVEANFDYDLLAPGTLIAKSLGRSVRLIRTAPSGEVIERRGVLQSGPAGVVVVIDGKAEALDCSGLHERLVFDDLPSQLTDAPTLSLLVRTQSAGRFEAQLSYLALGLDWSADYVADVQPDGRTLNLSAWLTLVNRQGSGFTNATTHVVAGNLARNEDETIAPQVRTAPVEKRCWPIGDFVSRARPVYAMLPAQAPMNDRMFKVSEMTAEQIVVTGSYVAKASELGDYKMYSVPMPTTVASRQIKQVRLLEQRNVRFDQIYEFRIDGDTEETAHPTVLLRLKNDKRSGLGLALPNGAVSVMNQNEGLRALAGEDSIQDTPIGGTLDINYATAQDVWTKMRVVAEDGEQATMEVEIANDKPVPIRLEVLHMRGDAEDFRVVESSHRRTTKNGEPLWSFQLQPGQRELLRYTIAQAR
jgi:hypothetical protein